MTRFLGVLLAALLIALPASNAQTPTETDVATIAEFRLQFQPVTQGLNRLIGTLDNAELELDRFNAGEISVSEFESKLMIMQDVIRQDEAMLLRSVNSIPDPSPRMISLSPSMGARKPRMIETIELTSQVCRGMLGAYIGIARGDDDASDKLLLSSYDLTITSLELDNRQMQDAIDASRIGSSPMMDTQRVLIRSNEAFIDHLEGNKAYVLGENLRPHYGRMLAKLNEIDTMIDDGKIATRTYLRNLRAERNPTALNRRLIEALETLNLVLENEKALNGAYKELARYNLDDGAKHDLDRENQILEQTFPLIDRREELVFKMIRTMQPG